MKQVGKSKLQRTHCWYCQKETNQRVLLDEFEMISEEGANWELMVSI